MDFDMLGLSPRLVTALKAQGLTDPTPIQAQAIPHAMNGRDVMGLAQTGTGKTAAFGLPLVHIMTSENRRAAPKTVSGLVLAPTRELVNQIAESLRGFAAGSGLKVSTVTGGVSIGRQVSVLERGVDLLVATPGRLLDLLDRRALTLGQTRFLVLDEADQMLDLGFIHALRKIAGLLPEQRQTMLFSATMPKQMSDLSAKYLTDPIRVQVAPPGKPIEKITQSVHYIEQNAKKSLLIRMLGDHPEELALVFARTKHGAERLKKQLEAEGFAAASVHGNKSQGQRDRAIAGVRKGELKVLVATDVAARGIDIPAVAHVYNFDLPNVAENYVHRIGRTARAGRDGRAVAFCSPEEMGELRDIEKTMNKAIPVAGGEPWQVTGSQGKGSKSNGRGGKPGRPGQAKQAYGKPAHAKSGQGGNRRRSGGGRGRSAQAA